MYGATYGALHRILRTGPSTCGIAPDHVRNPISRNCPSFTPRTPPPVRIPHPSPHPFSPCLLTPVDAPDMICFILFQNPDLGAISHLRPSWPFTTILSSFLEPFWLSRSSPPLQPSSLVRGRITRRRAQQSSDGRNNEIPQSQPQGLVAERISRPGYSPQIIGITTDSKWRRRLSVGAS